MTTQQDTQLTTIAYSFYELLQAGQVEMLLNFFTGEPLINTPLQGEVRGAAAFRQFGAAQQSWLNSLQAAPHLVDSVVTAERIAVEFSLDITTPGGERVDLPAAIVFDRDGTGISVIRVYHSTWPLTGQHLLRAPILALPATPLKEPTAVVAYMSSIEEPNEEFVLSLFTEAGYVREPSGLRYKHSGPAELKAFYDNVALVGGVKLHHCTATFDGRLFAVEYICDEWATVKIPAQAGISFYELSGRTKIAAVRIYDDVTPPHEA